MKQFHIIVIGMLALKPAAGQTIVTNLAHGGQRGIFVTLGFELPSPLHPAGDIVAYRVERKEAMMQSWQHLADVSAPESFAEFQARLAVARRFVPKVMHPRDLPEPYIWSAIDRDLPPDSLAGWAGSLVVRLALGIVYLDTSAQPAAPYHYRVSKLRKDGTGTETVMSDVAVYPSPGLTTQTRFVDRAARESAIRIRWQTTSRVKPHTVEPYRRPYLTGEFQPIDASVYGSTRKDTLYIEVIDRQVELLGAFEYYLLPFDAWGNPGSPSDTVFAVAYDPAGVGLPYNIRVESLDSLGGIKLSWRFDQPHLIQSFVIYRSAVFDSGYTPLAEVSAQDTEYFDQTAIPMRKYFYRIGVHGLLDEPIGVSATVFGIFQSTEKPLPPHDLFAEGVKNGVRLRWNTSEKHLKGFYVFRSNGYTEALEPLTGLIPSRDSITVFVDSSRSLSGSLVYAYAVRVENTSHVISDFSDTVMARPAKQTEPPAPVQFTVLPDENHFRLYWQNMVEFDNLIEGYRLYRREIQPRGPTTTFSPLTDSLLAANYHSDTTVQRGKMYQYAVQSVDMFGGVSALTQSPPVALDVPLPAPPAGVRGVPTPIGIDLRWDASGGETPTAYRIYRYERGKSAKRLAELKPEVTEFLDTTAQPGYLYFYYVTAINRWMKESEPSSEVGMQR